MLMTLTLTSPAFGDGETIPMQYTCDGDNTNPPLVIAGVPAEADSLVLLMDDPDIPTAVKEARGIEKFDHWVLYEIPATTTVIDSGAIVGRLGRNSAGTAAYTGPCPPPQYEPTEHRYFFRLYAIKGRLTLGDSPTLDEVQSAVASAAIEQVELMGRYERIPKEASGD